LEVEEIKDIQDITKKIEKIVQIYEKYIKDRSPSELNFSFELKKDVVSMLEEQKIVKEKWVLNCNENEIYQDLGKLNV
jgi:hypothetical protein